MRGIWKLNITVCLTALLFAMTGNSYAGNVEVKLPTNSAFQVISGVQPVIHVGSNGNVGIGTTSPTSKLQIGADLTFVDNYPTIGFNAYWNSPYWKYLTTESASQITNDYSLDGLRLQVAGQGIAGNNITFIDGLFIKNDGNVGIGTTSPTSKLHVNGNIRTDGDLNMYGAYTLRNNDYDLTLEANNNLVLRTGGANARMIINSSGNVGIGHSGPALKLDVGNGDMIIRGPGMFDATGETATLFLGQGDEWLRATHGDLLTVKSWWGVRFLSGTNSATEGMRLDVNGNVGIGTTNPSYKLHVNGTAAGTSWTNLSSREFKEDINVVGESEHPMMLAKLMDMDLTRYRYKKEYGGEGDAKLGFIAEEMPKEVLSKDGKGVDVYELLTFTIGAMKAQQKEIETQRQYNKALEDRLAALERLLEGK